MAKKILPGDMPSKTGEKRNGGAIPGRAPAPKSPSLPKRTPKVPNRRTAPVTPTKPKVGPIDSTRTGPPKTPRVGTDVPTPDTGQKPAPTVPAPNPKGTPKKANPAYRQFKNALDTPGMQAGEKEALARVMKNRGVNAKEARRIAKRRTARGLPTGRISRSA